MEVAQDFRTRCGADGVELLVDALEDHVGGDRLSVRSSRPDLDACSLTRRVAFPIRDDADMDRQVVEVDRDGRVRRRIALRRDLDATHGEPG